MIPQLVDKEQPSDWQVQLKNSVTRLDELLALVDLSADQVPVNLSTSQPFPLRVPRGFVQRMRRGDPFDPLLLQVLPLEDEEALVPDYQLDPLQERAYNPLPGLIHKYPGRVLLTVTGGCAIHCRYCFRRHFPYAENNPGQRGWQPVLDYVSADPSIHEVILSGGDPLLVKDSVLAQLAQRISTLSHVTTLRLHSRLPIVLPDRISTEFIHWVSQLPLRVVMVIHCNHPNEIDSAVGIAIAKMHQVNITVLNQAVLLKGINDTAETLSALSEKLFEKGVLPYYLHLLDKVQGAAHFAVAEAQAKQLLREVADRLPGYLVPKLVKEIPGRKAKQMLCF